MGLLKIVVIILAGLFIQFTAKVIYKLGFHKNVYNHLPGPCRMIKTMPYGSEDIQTLPNGISILSSGLILPMQKGNPVFQKIKGGIFMFDFKTPDQDPQQLDIEGNINTETFSPHGINIWTTDKGKYILFVVNHDKESNIDSIERFELDLKYRKLIHLESIFHSEFGMNNDIVATGERSFYVTNFLYSQSHYGVLLEIYLSLPWGTVFYFDGKDVKSVVNKLAAPNGINISPDKRYVYVSESALGIIHVYTRNKDNTLTLKDSIYTYTSSDNLDVTDEGDIWMGAQPILHQLASYAEDPSKHPASSQVLRIKMKNGEATSITEILVNDGSLISGSSSANYHQGAMLIGSVFTNPLYCKINHVE